ncbi:MAG: hypothetical protein ACXWWT_09815, partial [Candidatus Deferrimicrobiaceae bacterium]
QEQELNGYLVLQQYLSEYMPANRVNIVDWEAAAPHIRDGLLQAAVRLCPFREMYTWTASLGDGTRNLLRDAGFVPASGNREGAGVRSDTPCLLVRALQGNIQAGDWSVSRRRLSVAADWDIRMLYSMMG